MEPAAVRDQRSTEELLKNLSIYQLKATQSEEKLKVKAITKGLKILRRSEDLVFHGRDEST